MCFFSSVEVRDSPLLVPVFWLRSVLQTGSWLENLRFLRSQALKVSPGAWVSCQASAELAVFVCRCGGRRVRAG